jgi:hypothetical protein
VGECFKKVENFYDFDEFWLSLLVCLDLVVLRFRDFKGKWILFNLKNF